MWKPTGIRCKNADDGAGCFACESGTNIASDENVLADGIFIRPILLRQRLGDEDDAVRESYLAGFRAVMLATASVCVLSAIVAFVAIPGRLQKARAKPA